MFTSNKLANFTNLLVGIDSFPFSHSEYTDSTTPIFLAPFFVINIFLLSNLLVFHYSYLPFLIVKLSLEIRLHLIFFGTFEQNMI